MFTFLFWFTVVVLGYVALKVWEISKRQIAVTEHLQSELDELKKPPEHPDEPSPYGWHDGGWPYYKRSKQEERGTLENPRPEQGQNSLQTKMFMAEYKSIPAAHARKEYLSRLFRRGTWMDEEFLGLVYHDEDEFVRAWSAGHLRTSHEEYDDQRQSRTVWEFESTLERDTPLVRASLYSNPESNRVPWRFYRLKDDWKTTLREMTQLERLALMQNSELPSELIVGMLKATSEELGMTTEEHVKVVAAGLINPRIIDGSRGTGRDFWMVEGDVNPPFEEYGEIWKLATDRWAEQQHIAYMAFQYIQTTEKVKLETYERLLNDKSGKWSHWMREIVVRSCDPFTDAKVLKAAWSDPDDACRKAAVERVGNLKSYVGVK